ncbi:TadE/TadG family type IV pilus assembly protein [Albidovulum sediminicola]|uniref:Pilus assembly protein n=1 Tax=Albidovulum sediminicola TaxID=2984331 RepID=A0ABT2Z3A7_9RHOB|nr:TadE/TadG family type IV pilus assembly protein [Defluviimonas sp. WL0075]MCV2865635.1 pilus assembly protein [Defluviimonas sp. WL0075]
MRILRIDLPKSLRRFLRREEGAILVEFAFSLPILLIFFAVIVEGTRMMKNYHTAISGVRDATRYMSRHLPIDLCNTAPTANALSNYDAILQTIVGRSVSNASLFPSGITLTSVRATYTCPSNSPAYHVRPAVVRVAATMTVNFPFSSAFELLGGQRFSGLTTTISDSVKVFGT